MADSSFVDLGRIQDWKKADGSSMDAFVTKVETTCPRCGTGPFIGYSVMSAGYAEKAEPGERGGFDELFSNTVVGHLKEKCDGPGGNHGLDPSWRQA